MSDVDRAYHHSFKPCWTKDGVLIFSSLGERPLKSDSLMVDIPGSIVSEGRTIRKAKFAVLSDVCNPLTEEMHPS